MRTQHRRFLALAAATAVASGTGLAAAQVAPAAPVSAGATQAPGTPQAVGSTQTPGATRAVGTTQNQNDPVLITLDGFPGTLTAGAPAVEFTATLRNSADHEVATQSGFTVADVDAGIRETQLRLEFQAPGSTEWRTPRLHAGANVGAMWDLEAFGGEPHLPAGASVTYRLRLAVTADARGGRASALFRSTVSDPGLPAWQQPSYAISPLGSFTIAPVGTPTTPPPAPVPVPGAPTLGMDGVPAMFTGGAPAQPFGLTIANHSGRDIRFLPQVGFQGNDALTAATTRLDFQTPGGEWLAATDEGQSEPGQLRLTLRAGGRDLTVIALHDGESRTVNVRLSFTADVPNSTAQVLFTGSSIPLAPGGTEVRHSGPAADFGIAAAAAPGRSSTPVPPAAGPAAPAGARSETPASSGAAVVPVSRSTGSVAGPAAVAAAPQATKLASTGGGTKAEPMAITGATAVAMGVGLLVVAGRRATRSSRN
ncbi:hypothetical protein J5Y04_36035 [Kitasatospora sp. RG8]|nr:hypothetical protein [Kitasatospora sp. RG8]